MSVTFRPSAMQYEEVEMKCCCCDYNNGKPEDDCFICNGAGAWIDHEPAEGFCELNASNANAAEILRNVIPEIYYEDLCGEWDSRMQDRVFKNIMKILNKENNPLIRASVEEGNFINIGVDADRAERKVLNLAKVIQCCKKHNCSLVFS